MNLRKKYFFVLIILSFFVHVIYCQQKANPEKNVEEEIEPTVIGSPASSSRSTQSNNSNSNSNSNKSSQSSSTNSRPNSSSNNSSNNSSSISSNTSSSGSSSSNKSNDIIDKYSPSSATTDSAIPENKSNFNEDLSSTNSTESTAGMNSGSSVYKVEKAKAERIETFPINKEDLSSIKWNEFDHYGFKIAISTPNEFNDDSVINIKWQAVEDMEPSSTIKIELHTNLTRRNDYIAYPTTETIVIDDNIPKNINEINWNPYLKLKKNEKYYIRIWAYTNNNTATMSGLCIWSINDLLEDKQETVKTSNKTNYVKVIAFPTVGALLCFTVIGHFVLESKKHKKYSSVNNSGDDDLHDGIASRGDNLNYDAIKTEGNGFCTLPQPWELEAKRKHMYLNQSSLSDWSNYQKIGNSQDQFNNVILNDAKNNNEPISLTVEKPESTMIQKIPKFPVDNPATIRTNHHHHHHNSSSGSSYDSHASLL